jgi:hypothetical protein
MVVILETHPGYYIIYICVLITDSIKETDWQPYQRIWLVTLYDFVFCLLWSHFNWRWVNWKSCYSNIVWWVHSQWWKRSTLVNIATVICTLYLQYLTDASNTFSLLSTSMASYKIICTDKARRYNTTHMSSTVCCHICISVCCFPWR